MFLSQVLIYCIFGVATLGILYKPFIGVIAYYVLDIIRPQDLFFWAFEGSRLSLWIGGITIISWLLHLKESKKNRIKRWSTQNKLMLLFGITVVISHIFSSYKDISWISFMRISKMVIFYFIAGSLIISQKRMRWLIWSMVISICYLALRGNWQYFVLGHPDITGLSFGSYNVPLDNNGYAMLFVMALPFTYFLVFTEKMIFLKALLIALMPLLIHAIILTYSRGGFLGLVVVCLFCLLKTKKKLAIAIVGILFITVIVRLAGPPVIERLNTINDYEQDASAMGRLQAWKAGLKMMMDHPIAGVGLDNFRYIAMSYNPEGVQGIRVAHNAYIHIGSEAGIPGLLAYILLLISSIKDLGKLRKSFYSDEHAWKYYYPAMVEGSLWGYIVCGMFLTLAWFELFYPIIALTVALKRVTHESEVKVAVKKPRRTYKLSGSLEPLKV